MRLFSRKQQPELKKLPRHVGIIMDGNGRWAKARFLPRSEGHRAGVKIARSTALECKRWGIGYLTLYAFSSENWFRPQQEVDLLMSLLERYLLDELESSLKNNIRLRVIGDRARLNHQLQELIEQAEQRTLHCDSMTLCLALSYGGRQEITQAARKLAEMVRAGQLHPDAITEELIGKSVYAPDVPDADLIIRTSNEFRTSNFLLWKAAYAEYVFTPVLWPDFSASEFERCLLEYQSRSRRFGRTEEPGAEPQAAER